MGDWLPMGKKLRKKSFRKSIKKDFAFYIILYIFSSLLLGFICSQLFLYAHKQIRKKYYDEYQNKIEYIEGKPNTAYHYYNDNDVKIEIHYSLDILTLFTPVDRIKSNILGIASGVVYPLSFIVCLSLISILFYKKILQQPLELLGAAADKIADNNLDFTIHYDRPDEFGRLCQSFEKMRSALHNNHLELWRQIEERRRLNAAFAHDLRTPLTVLKGQSDILIKYTPELSEEKIIETAKMMQRHIARLENYVNTMNTLQRLEDIEIHCKSVDMVHFVKQLRDTGACICTDKRFVFQKTQYPSLSFGEEDLCSVQIALDVPIILQVYENLLSNAVRYAEEQVTVSTQMIDNNFHITVSDDGAGFSAQDLCEATRPFYKAAGRPDQEHFGIGLNICKVLCEKHGGFLKLENKNGAAVTAAFQIE